MKFPPNWTYSWPRRRELVRRQTVRRIVVVWCKPADGKPSQGDEPRR